MRNQKYGLKSTPSGLNPTVRLGLLCAGSGFASVLFAFRLFSFLDQPVFIWPVSGAILALLLPVASEHPKKKFAFYLCGVAGAFAAEIMLGVNYRLAAIIATLVTADLLVTGALLIPKIHEFDDLKQPENIVRFVVATILSPLLTWIPGAFFVSRLLRLPVYDVAMPLASADAIGIALLLPLCLLIRRAKGADILKPAERRLQPFMFVALFVLVAMGVFWQDKGPFLFAIFPPMILVLLETGLEGAVLAAWALTCIGWFATEHGHGPIWIAKGITSEDRLATLQFFIWVSVVTAMPIAAALNERKKAERHSRNAEAIHDVLLRYASEVIVLSALDGTHRHVSNSIQSLTGWTPEEFISQNRHLTIHPDDRDRTKSMLTGVALGTVNRFRYRLLGKDGSSRWVDATVHPYGDDAVDGYVKTLRDISDFVQSEQDWNDERRRLSEEQGRLAEAEQATQLQLELRDEFLSHVSHELRSPLTSIYSFTTIIDDGLAGEPTLEQKEYLAIILKNVAQLRSMIEDLLTVTQTKEGKLSIRKQRCSIAEAVADVVRNLESTARTAKISFSWVAENHVPDVLADPVRVRQVLTILMDNALKFTPRGGSVNVSLRRLSANFVLAEVTDTGCGIPKDKWTKVFEKLYQIAQTSHSDTSQAGRTGLGLGLHIAKYLVTRHGGQIWATSELDKGSVFHFTLPTFRDCRNSSRSVEIN